MLTRISDRLTNARRHRIVGRADERQLFLDALRAPELPFVVLQFYGPGGIGKSTLVRSFVDHCQAEQIPCIYRSGREIDPSPAGLMFSLGNEPLTQLTSSEQRQVFVLDNFESLEPIEGWLRERFLPTFSSETLVILAGRNPLSTTWRSDLDWQDLLRLVPLRNFSSEESRNLLHSYGVPSEHHESILSFTQGYPLALSLISDLYTQRGTLALEQGSPPPDVITTLLERFVEDVPSPQHREALEACALVRVTTEPILAQLMGSSQVRPYFEWLRGLNIVEPMQPGVAPHSIAREVLTTDLRWRSPDRYGELHRRARNYYTERLALSEPQEQQRLLWDLIYLHRDNAVIRSAFTWQDTVSAYVDLAQASELPELEQMVARHEGTESAALFQHWAQQPHKATTLVFRSSTTGALSGLLMLVAVDRTDPEDAVLDPAMQRAHTYLASQPPLRVGERTTYFRFWLADETYQGVSPVQSLIVVNCVRHYLTTPGLAYSFFPCANPDPWVPAFAYAELPRCPAADFMVGGHRYGVFVYDWRSLPPMTWLSVLAEKEIAGTAVRERPEAIVPLVVLSRDAFFDAIRDALRHFDRPETLTRNLLLRSRLVVEKVAGASAPPSQKVAILRTLLQDAITGLEHFPRRARAYRALNQTFLQPSMTQEKAAEQLAIPFSTYRRHLTEGIEYVAEALWQQELETSLK